MKFSTAILTLLAVPAATATTFSEYLKEHHLSYPDVTEYARREAIFQKELKEVIEFNSGNSTGYKKGLNHFSVYTDEEKKEMLGYSKTLGNVHNKNGGFTSSEAVIPEIPLLSKTELPAHVDWREKGVVTTIKNQGHCGSCWAFASTAVLESHVALSTGLLNELSPQQFVSCAPNDNHCGGVGGCQGSTAALAYEYLSSTKNGIYDSYQYPYTSWTGESNGECHAESDDFEKNGIVPVAHVTGYVNARHVTTNYLQNLVATVGPIAINVAATGMHNYNGGIYDGCSTGVDFDNDINHVVVVEGYGHDETAYNGKGADYWLVRNSWTASFGENGYIRMLKTDDLRCETDNTPEDGVECALPDNGSEPVEICGECGLLYEVTYPLVSE